MSKEDTEVVVDNIDNVEEVELSPAEEKATASGWRPEDEWEGDPDEWIDARTFNRNGEFMSRIQHQSKQMSTQAGEIENLNAAMKQLGEHNKKIAETEYKKAIASLKKEKVSALEDEDHASVVEIDDKIDELKESKKAMDVAVVNDADHPVNADVVPDPAFATWASKNSWYQSDTMLRGAADAIGMEYADNNKGAPIEDVLLYVTNKMKEEFPNKFGNVLRSNPSSVTEKAGSGKRVKKAKYTARDLSEEQREFAKAFVNSGAFDSVQEYVDQLAANGDL